MNTKIKKTIIISTLIVVTTLLIGDTRKTITVFQVNHSGKVIVNVLVIMVCVLLIFELVTSVLRKYLYNKKLKNCMNVYLSNLTIISIKTNFDNNLMKITIRINGTSLEEIKLMKSNLESLFNKKIIGDILYKKNSRNKIEIIVVSPRMEKRDLLE